MNTRAHVYARVCALLLTVARAMLWVLVLILICEALEFSFPLLAALYGFAYAVGKLVLWHTGE